MDQEIKPSTSREMQLRAANATEGDDIDEIVSPQDNTLKKYASKLIVKAASTRIGQKVIDKVDRVLGILELTARWSLPQGHTPQLERPLPWVLFLALIIWLRCFRIWSSVSASVMGTQGVTPQIMVNFIQNQRSNLNALRETGLKCIEDKKRAKRSTRSSCENLTFRNSFYNNICNHMQFHTATATKGVVVTDNTEEVTQEKSQPTLKRPRDDDCRELDMTTMELLELFANADSESDSDYVPPLDEEESSSSSSDSSTVEEEMLDASQEISFETAADGKGPKTSEAEVKKNSEPQQQANLAPEPTSDTETSSEGRNNSKDVPAQKNGISEAEAEADAEAEQQCNVISESNAAPIEVGNASSPQNILTPESNPQTQLAVPLTEKPETIATPAPATAASDKSALEKDTNKGSPQEFSPILHPAPSVNDSTTEDFHFSSNLNTERSGKA